MFVKIRYSDVERDSDGCIIKDRFKVEHLYDCNHFSLFPSKPVPPAINETEMNLTLEFNTSGPAGWDRTISFPWESDSEIVEIFVMNEHGKTIDRFIY